MLKTRLITAAVIGPLFLGAVFWLPLTLFQWFVAAMLAFGGWEWANLAGIRAIGWRLLYAVLFLLLPLVPIRPETVLILLWAAGLFWLVGLFWVQSYPHRTLAWRHPAVRLLMGLLVLVPTWVALTTLKAGDGADALLLLLILLVWGADVGAYFAGKTWGKAKLAPRVSPGKTLAGVYGGLATSLIIALLWGLYWQLAVGQLAALMAVVLVAALASVLGDLLVSMLKRERGIKDSGRLLPGHGGVMDRIDSLTAAAPLFVLGTTLAGLGSVVTA